MSGKTVGMSLDRIFTPSNFISEINLDDLWELSQSTEGVKEGIRERFDEWKDRSEIYEDKVCWCVFCSCKYPKSVDQATIELLVRQFLRFKNLIIVFRTLSYQSRCKLGLTLTVLGEKNRIEMFKMNGSSEKIYLDLNVGRIYLNSYAPVIKPN